MRFPGLFFFHFQIDHHRVYLCNYIIIIDLVMIFNIGKHLIPKKISLRLVLETLAAAFDTNIPISFPRDCLPSPIISYVYTWVSLIN